jgi:hypothetical protein
MSDTQTYVDLFTAMYPKASEGQWVKDMSKQKRGLGIVKAIHPATNGMKVFWVKTNTSSWVIYYNHGHYHPI